MVPGGVFYDRPMSEKPKYAMAFIDGQNLFQHAKDAFGHFHPNYDPKKLHAAVCSHFGWTPNLVRFYTGVPLPQHSEMWAGYWSNRILSLKRQGVNCTTRKLRYHREEVTEADGSIREIYTPQEKGVDVRLALDLVKFGRKKNFDVAVLFSQDQDLAEVVDEIKEIASEQEREIEIYCPFPSGPSASSRRGVDRTNWFPMDEDFYNKCLDPRDYRPPKR